MPDETHRNAVTPAYATAEEALANLPPDWRAQPYTLVAAPLASDPTKAGLAWQAADLLVTTEDR